MNIYQSLNKVIEYIEQHLEEEILYNKLAQILGVNEYTMQSVFRLLCNISISEYIRNRRLSNSGFDLCHTNEKVIDIAVKYQYDNATSFSRAFEKFHGIKPSQVKKNLEGLKNYTRIHFDETQIVPKENMEYSIIEKEELILYGKGIKTTEEEIGKDAPKFFEKMIKEYNKKYGNISYGMTVYEKRFESDELEYWTLYDKPISEFTKYIIPKSRWIVFRINSTEAMDIQKLTNQFYEEFVPSCKYNFKPIPELEYYHNNVTDFMIAVEN